MIYQTAEVEDTVYFWFGANDTSGSGGDGATPLFDVREGGAAAGAIPLLSGTPTLLTHANFPPGCYEIAVAATVTNGFAADDIFAVFCTLLIDSQNPTGFVGACKLTPLAKQSQLDNLANVGSATNTSATTYVLTTGTQSSGTFASTVALDGTNHEHTDAAGVMDLYYEFNIGGGTPSSVKVTGYLNGNNDDLEVYGYDWIAAGWVQIGTLAGKVSAVNEVDEYDLFTSMVGTGANRGLVRIRFTDGAFTLTSATLAIDQIFVSYSAASAGYDGFIWYDSNASNTNTVSNVDGTSGNPVSSEAAVVTLSANLNINRIKILPGSTYTLASTYNNYFFDGDGIWTLVLGDEDVGGTTFKGASVSGVGTGSSEILFIDCEMGTATIHPFHIDRGSLTGTLTFGAAGDYRVSNSHSDIAGATTPIIDMGAALANTNLTMPGYDQGIEIRNLNAVGTDLFSISGQGQIIYAASSSGAVNQRGEWLVTNIGGVTITKDDNTQGIADTLADTGEIGTAGAGLTNINLPDQTMNITGDITGNLSGSVGSLTGHTNQTGDTYVLAAGATGFNALAAFLDTEIAAILEDTGTTIPGLIAALNDPTAAAIADAVWDEVLTAATHDVPASAGKRLRLASEIVQIDSAIDDPGAAATTTVFNTDLTEVDDFWNDALLIFTSGALAGQSRTILNYANADGQITMDEALTSIPADNVTFAIKSDHIHPTSQIVNALLTTQMTESYAADGVAPTLAQAAFAIMQQAGEFSIAGTTITVKKLDGSTTAMTFTLDDGTNPTSRTRAT